MTGEGIDRLREMILRLVRGDSGAQQESGFLTNVRQQGEVQNAIAALDAATAAVPLKTPHEMILLDLYGALHALDEITGATTADDILNLIFGSFCIGKWVHHRGTETRRLLRQSAQRSPEHRVEVFPGRRKRQRVRQLSRPKRADSPGC